VVRELLDAARRDQERGRLDAAIEGYREALKLSHQVVQIYVALGALYHQQGQRQEALEIFQQGLEQAPGEQALLRNAATVALELGQPELALELAERAVASAPDDADLRYLHGAVLRRLGRAAEAVATLQRGLNARPKDPHLLFSLGNAHHQLGALEAAIAAFRAAVKADRDYLPAHYNLGAVLFEAERFPEAREAYEVALAPVDKALARGDAVESIHAQAYLNLGAVFLREENWRRALDAYSKAARLAPESAPAQYHLGYTLYRLGDIDAADATYRKALALDSDLPVAHLHLAEIEAGRQRPAAVVEQLRVAVDQLEGANRERALELLAAAHLATGDEDAAEANYRQLRQLRPEDGGTALALGTLLRRRGQHEEARTLLEAALRSQPHKIAAGLELATLARGEGDPEAARALYLQVLEGQEEAPALVPVRLNLALVLLQLGDRAGARRYLASLPAELSAQPGLGTAHALLLLGEGEAAAARAALESVVRRHRDYPAATAALAALDAFEGRPEAAAEALAAQLSQVEAKTAALLRADLGQLLWVAGQGQAARPHLEFAADTFPRWPGPRVALGEVALAAGDLETAQRHLETAGALCGEPGGGAPLSRPGEGAGGARSFQLLVEGDDAPEGLCRRAAESLGAVRGALAYGALVRGDSSRAAALAERALAVALAPPERARAHFVRGSAALLQGRDEAARRDLTTALGGSLATSLEAIARNNLGVALHRLGRSEDSRRQFQAAGTGSAVPPETLLNQGIAAEAAGEGASALALYERYLAAVGNGGRRQEVAQWVTELRRVYP
jgi:tetratricopeptide (TPR) repeat protein